MRKALGKAWLQLAGWTVAGTAPDAEKYVLIAAPHTSNWDLVYALAAAAVLGIPLHWMGKDSLFRGPSGVALRSLGGIPVERNERHALVQTMVEELKRQKRFALLVPAEGTRKAGEYWKSGFYHTTPPAGVALAPRPINNETTRQRLKSLSPESYLGLAIQLTDRIIKEA